MNEQFELGKDLWIKAGAGFWDVTFYPLGGCFKRAPRDAGLPVVSLGVVSTYTSGEAKGVKVAAGKMVFVVGADKFEESPSPIPEFKRIINIHGFEALVKDLEKMSMNDLLRKRIMECLQRHSTPALP